MKLQGFDVNEGNSVYDLVFGYGLVRNVTDDGFEVRFNDTRSITYNSEGVGQFKNPTLFWHNPIVLIPAKEDKTWSLQSAVAKGVSELIAKAGGKDVR